MQKRAALLRPCYVDPTMLCAVNKLASSQAAPSPATLAQADRILQFAAKHPNVAIVLKASDMQLQCHSDESYLSEANSRSRTGGSLFLGDADITNGVFGAFDYLSATLSSPPSPKPSTLHGSFVCQLARHSKNSASPSAPQKRSKSIVHLHEVVPLE
jgi:hypothetical protein